MGSGAFMLSDYVKAIIALGAVYNSLKPQATGEYLEWKN